MTTMLVGAHLGPSQAGLVAKPMPSVKEDFCLVKIHSAPMCTEYRGFADDFEGDWFGHEAAGEVVEVAQPGKVKVGDRVAVMPQAPCGKCPLCLAGEYIHCQHCVNATEICDCEVGGATYAQYCIKQDWLLVPIPDDMSYDHGAMACCGIGPTFGAMQLMQVNGYDTVMVTGLGPVGLGGVINGVSRDARVIAVDMNDYRRNLASDLGAELTVNPSDDNALEQIMDFTKGVGVDKAVDCSGAPQAQRLMIDAARRKGQASFVGEGSDLTITISDDMIRKGITLRGSWHYNIADTQLIMRVISEQKERIDKLISHTFPMSKLQEAWELQCTGNCAKVCLHPWE